MGDSSTLENLAVLYRQPTTAGIVGLCQKLGATAALEIIVILAIVINTLFLMYQNPANRLSEGVTLFLTAGDLFLSALFTVEMFIRIIGMGFIGHRGYLDDSWNRLDFIVVISSWVNIMVELFDFDLGIEVSTLRALRILRVLRSLRFFKGIKTILAVVYSALPLAYNVVVFLCFLFVVCGIIGVQMFRGATIHRCAPGGFELMATIADMKPPIASTSSLAAEVHMLSRPEPGSRQANMSQPALACDTDQDSLGLTGEYPIGIGIWHNYCGVDDDGNGNRKLRHSDCPLFNKTLYETTGCSPQLCFVVPNPGKGTHSYDNILYAWTALFINMAQLYWWETAHRYYDANIGLGSTIAWGFGIFNIMFLTYVSVNMFVAVITTVFADVRSIENASGGMTAEDSPADKLAQKEQKYQERLDAWTKPFYYVAFFGGEGPFKEKMKPGPGKYPMDIAMRDEVEVEAYFPLRKEWLKGKVIQLDDAETKYKVEFTNKEEETVWVKRKRIRVAPELEKSGIINQAYFDQFILMFIFINTFALAAEHHDPTACQGSGEPAIICQSEGFIGFMGALEYVFNFVFTVECIMKVCGMGFGPYIAVGFNKLDFFIVVTSALDMAAELVDTGEEGGIMSIFKLFRVFRLFRVLRVARVLYRNENLKKLLQTVFGSGEALGNLTLFIMFSTLLFGIMGMHLFGGNYIEIRGDETFWGRLNGNAQYYKHDTHTTAPWESFEHDHESRHTYGYDVGELINKSLIPRRNFEDMPRAFLLAFQIITGDDWVNQMHDHMAVYNLWAPPLLFYTAFVFCNYTLLSLFIAVILENFEIAEVEKLELQKQAAAKKAEDEEKAKSTPKVSFVNRLTWMVRGEGYREGSKCSYARPANIDEEGYFLPGEKWYNDDKALFCLPPDNPFRINCEKLFKNPIFDNFLTLCILLSTVMLCIEGPAGSLDQDILDVFGIIGHVLFAIFMFEFIVKIIGMGFVFTPKSYIKDPWNKLDFVVIMASILGYVPGQEDSKAGRIFRLLRCLRPLRIVNRNAGMKVIITAVINSLGVNLSVLMLAFMLLLIFGILGVNLFAGQFWFCTCSHVYPFGTGLSAILAGEGVVDAGNNQTVLPRQVVTRDDCLGPGYWTEDHPDNGTNYIRNGTIWGIDPNFPNAVAQCAWENAPYSFDDTWEAIMALFTASTLAGWTDIMERSMDMSGFNRQPVYFNSSWAVLYYIMFIFCMAFFITNLFIGVLIDFIGHSDGTALLTEDQQKWIDTQRFQKLHKSVGEDLNPQNFHPVRKVFFKLVESPQWDALSNFVIIFNVFIMMLEYEHMSQSFWDLLEYLNLACLVYFTIEMVFKLLGYLPVLYWKDHWNKFDCIVVLVSWLAIILDLGSVQAVRAFRAFRIVLVLKRAKGIRSLFGTLMMSIPACTNISVLLMLLYALYAILGMQLFGNEPIQDSVFWRTPDCRSGVCTSKVIPWSDYDDECGSDPSTCTVTVGKMLHGSNRQYTSHDSFRNFFDAMGLLFQCAAGQDWKFVMYALESDDSPKTLVFWYFSSFFFFSNYILANLFVATILDNFSACLREESLEIREEDIVIVKEKFRSFSMEGAPDSLLWDKLEEFITVLGEQRSQDGDGNAVEFPMAPPPVKTWSTEQLTTWSRIAEEHTVPGVDGLADGPAVQRFLRAVYSSTPLLNDDGVVCNPLYGAHNEPGGFCVDGENRSGGKFDDYWGTFCSTPTTSTERPSAGDPTIAALQEAANGDGGIASFESNVSFEAIEDFVKRLRWRHHFDHIVHELNFHGHTYEQDSMRYTHVLQAMVNARLGTEALSLEEQVERGIVTIEAAQKEVADDFSESMMVTSENPMYSEGDEANE